MKKVSIINKFGPRSNAITAKNASEVADYLAINGVDVTFFCLSASYKSEDNNAHFQDLKFKVKEIRNFYRGKSSLLRLVFGFIDGFRLWMVSLTSRAHVAIVMTDPPLLIFWFQVFRKLSKQKLFYWAMDIYPEAFAAGKYVRPNNIFYRFFNSIVYKRVPDVTIALGTKQLEFLQHKFNKPLAHVILPCGVIDEVYSSGSADKDKITFGYGGNIGEAHDADFLVSLIKQLDPNKHEMILSLYGSKSLFVKHEIGHTNVVHYKEFLSYQDIASIDVNVATILPDWNHICVPSKAVTAICCGSSLLLNGTRETDAWNMFEGASWLVEPSENYELQLPAIISGITKAEILKRKTRALKLNKTLVQEKLTALQTLLTQIKSDY